MCAAGSSAPADAGLGLRRAKSQLPRQPPALWQCPCSLWPITLAPGLLCNQGEPHSSRPPPPSPPPTYLQLDVAGVALQPVEEILQQALAAAGRLMRDLWGGG